MRLLTTVLCFLVVACVTAPLAFSQDFVPTPVEISKEKVNVNGEIFYLHNSTCTKFCKNRPSTLSQKPTVLLQTL